MRGFLYANFLSYLIIQTTLHDYLHTQNINPAQKPYKTSAKFKYRTDNAARNKIDLKVERNLTNSIIRLLFCILIMHIKRTDDCDAI